MKAVAYKQYSHENTRSTATLVTESEREDDSEPLSDMDL